MRCFLDSTVVRYCLADHRGEILDPERDKVNQSDASGFLANIPILNHWKTNFRGLFRKFAGLQLGLPKLASTDW
jgi:hypothetical protein